MKKTTYAAAALTVLVSLGTIGATTMESDDTSPHRTVVQAAPEPCPYPMARCAPIPPAPATRMTVEVPEEPNAEVADEYTRAWEGIEVAR